MSKEKTPTVLKVVKPDSKKLGWFLQQAGETVTLRYRHSKDEFPWYVAQIRGDGRLYLVDGITKDTGVEVNKNGEIVVRKYAD